MKRWYISPFVFLISITATQPGHAQYNACRVRSFYPTYYAPTYVAPYTPPIKHDKEIKVVKVEPDFYYSVSDSYRDALLADAIAYRVLLAQRVGSSGAAPPFVPRLPESHPNPYGSVPPQPQNPVEQPKGPAPAFSNVSQVIGARCAKCHSGMNGIDLSDPNTVTKGQRWHAYALAASGEMPKGGTPIPDQEVRALYEWAKSAKK